MRNAFKKIIATVLRRQVRRLLNAKHPTIVAVGGSVGKTSTKLAIAKVLAVKYRVLVQEGSYNTEIGLPLAIFNLDTPTDLANPLAWLKIYRRTNQIIKGSYPYDVLVLELGTDHPGEIPAFMEYLQPDIGVITAVTPEHMEGFADMTAVLEEEFALAEGSRQVLLNAEDAQLITKRNNLKDRPVLTFGANRGDYRVELVKRLGRRVDVILHLPGGEAKLDLNVIGRHSLIGIAAAAAVGHLMDLTLDEMKPALEKVDPVHGRMQPLTGLKSSFIIDDSYNSSPAAAIAALDTLGELPAERRIALLGSMNELGAYSESAHQEVGRHATLKADLVLSLGREANQYLAPAAISAGLAADQVKTFDSPYQVGQWLAGQIQKGDVVLVKGSQNGVFAEEAIKSILADPKDATKLVRQSPAWLKIKEQQFGIKRPVRHRVSITLPKRLLQNNVKLSRRHLKEVELLTAIERGWYANQKPFETLAEILAAAQTGRLTKIESNKNYLPIMRFRNPALAGVYPPYLKTDTSRLLQEVTNRWRHLAEQAGIDSQIRLAVTALVMTETYRDTLLKAGKLAIDKGPHVLGEAFDIDGCGYYFDERPINPRQGEQANWDKAFDQMDAQLDAPRYGDYNQYNPRVHQILKSVLEEMQSESKLHFVHEYPGTTNASFHICRHPDYLAGGDTLR